MKGAPDITVNLCNQIYRDGGVEDLTEGDRLQVLAANEAMASQALRVLAVAYKPLQEVPEKPAPRNWRGTWCSWG